jgi:hypothetical protein
VVAVAGTTVVPCKRSLRWRQSERQLWVACGQSGCRCSRLTSSRALSVGPERKVTTRRDAMRVARPVLGLRPGRCRLSRNWKDRKPANFTLSPPSSASRITSNKASTISFAYGLLRPTRSRSNSASSAFVSAGVSVDALASEVGTSRTLARRWAERRSSNSLEVIGSMLKGGVTIMIDGRMNWLYRSRAEIHASRGMLERVDN